MIKLPILPTNVIVLANKDILLRDHYLLAKELAVAIGLNKNGTYIVRSLDGKRTNNKMVLNLDFRIA